MTSSVAARLLALLVLTAGIPALSASAQQAPVRMAQLQTDLRPSAQLNDAELRQRIRANRSTIKSGQANKQTRRILKQQIRSDKGELKNRLRAKRRNNQPANGNNTGSGNNSGNSNQNAGAGATTPPPATPRNQGANRSQNRAMAIIADGRRASDLSDGDLQKRINAVRSVVRDRAMARRLRKRLKRVLARDLAELRNRNATPRAGGGRGTDDDLRPQVDPAVERLVTDTRPAKRLGERELRQRINQTSRVVRQRNVSRAHRNQLSRMLRADRAELRRRIAATNNQGGNGGSGGTTVLNAADRQARQVLADRRAPAQMGDRQIKQRMGRYRRVLAMPGLSRQNTKVLRARLLNDRNELRRRNIAAGGQGGNGGSGGTTAPSAADNEALRLLSDRRTAGSLNDNQLRRRLADLRRVLALPGLSRKSSKALRLRLARGRAEQRARSASANNNGGSGGTTAPSAANAEALRLLADRRQSGRLRDNQLRRRLAGYRRVLALPGLSVRNSKALRRRLASDRRELRARVASANGNGGIGAGGGNPPPIGAGNGAGGSGADRLATRLLADNRRPEELTQNALRNRIANLRAVLRNPDLSPRFTRRVRQRLLLARREAGIRRANAGGAGNGGTGGGTAAGNGAGDDIGNIIVARRLLRNAAPASQLSDRQLRRRILTTGELLRSRSFPLRLQQRLRALRRADRRERRTRFFAARDRRRIKYRRRSGIDLNITIAPPRNYAPRPNIEAAEVDQYALERQLVAPPTRPIRRRYTMQEYRSRPSLRQSMPGIELDTIKFGFNEYVVREEQIDELEKLALIIERIVAARPNEIFLIEGHTDAVVSPGYNLALSRKRALAVKQALTDYFVIEARNLETIGYGEQFLKIPTPEAEPENRRVTIRRITPVLR